jgi:integrase
METNRAPEAKEKAGSNYPKTDVRFWASRLFTRTTNEWQVRVGYAGRQERFPLKTANKEEAAAKAKEIYLSLHAIGWEKTIAKFKPWTTEPEPKAKSITVGTYLDAFRAVAPIKPTTLLSYERKFRKLVADIVKVSGTKKQKHDYFSGAAEQYRQKVNLIELAQITPERVAKWRVDYLAAAGKNPVEQNAARTSAASIIRNSKTLFSRKYLPLIKLPLPSPLPFDGVTPGKQPRHRYRSTIRPELLVNLAAQELRDAPKPEPRERQNQRIPRDGQEVYKIFLLAFGAGLRRGEIDKLTWKQINWEAGTITLEATEYGDLKTAGSADKIDIGPQLSAYFKDQFAQSQSEFVVTSAVVEEQPKHWNHYRCDRHFRDLIEWLKEKGVSGRNPIHTLRKEFGSLINREFGIFAASSALRHSNIGITRDYYVDNKERIALDLSTLTATKGASNAKA